MNDLAIMKETGLDRESLDLIRRGYREAPRASYGDTIAAAIGCDKPEIVNAVEDSVRGEWCNQGCLDHLDKQTLSRYAREAFAQYEYIMGKQIIKLSLMS